MRVLCARSFRERKEHEWESFVSMHRPSFTSEFFGHLENLVMAEHADPAQQEGKMSNLCDAPPSCKSYAHYSLVHGGWCSDTHTAKLCPRGDCCGHTWLDPGGHANSARTQKCISWCAELAAMATKVLALVTSYDETTANEEAMAGAAQQFDDLLQVHA